jgi:hypothetical protein
MSSRPPAPSQLFDEPPAIEMRAAGAMGNVDDLLAVTEETEELARQITSRPPVKPPVVPPSSKASAAAAARTRATSMRPQQPGGDDALLTPQELAAAFQLDFSPANPPPQRQLRPPRRLAMVAAVLMLIALGATALLYLRPDLRRKASAWGEATLASVKSFIASRTSPAAPVPSPTATTRPGGMMPGSSAPAHGRVDQPVAITPTPPPAPPRKVAVIETPLSSPPKPAVPPPAPAAAKTDAAQVATAAVKAEATPDRPKAPAPAPAPPRTKRHFNSITEAYDEEKLLWGKAIDAEANQDYVEAVRCYEEIKLLPVEVQPPALDVRLELARRRIK